MKVDFLSMHTSHCYYQYIKVLRNGCKALFCSRKGIICTYCRRNYSFNQLLMQINELWTSQTNFCLSNLLAIGFPPFEWVFGCYATERCVTPRSKNVISRKFTCLFDTLSIVTQSPRRKYFHVLCVGLDQLLKFFLKSQYFSWVCQAEITSC